MRAALIGNLKELGRRALAGALSGFFWGFVIGGAGGRLAMFVLRLTTGDSVKGVESDDGFIIGAFTSDTIFLLAATTIAGAAIGIFYVLVRGWLPEKRRALLVAAFFGLAGGAAIIRPDGVDFTLLKPLPLAIAMFVLLPGLYGFAMSLTTEKFLVRLRGSVASWLGVAAGAFALFGMGLGSIGGLVFVLLPALFGFAMSHTVEKLLIRLRGTVASWLGGAAAVFALIGMGLGSEVGLVFVLLLILLFVGVSVAGGRFDWVRRVPTLPAVVWAARGILIAVTGFAAVVLVRDIVQVL